MRRRRLGHLLVELALDAAHVPAVCADQLVNPETYRECCLWQFEMLMLLGHCRGDGADRESRETLRLAAAAADCQGGDLGHLPRELAPDAAHVPAVCAGHPHTSGRDPGQQGANLRTAALAQHIPAIMITSRSQTIAKICRRSPQGRRLHCCKSAPWSFRGGCTSSLSRAACPLRTCSLQHELALSVDRDARKSGMLILLLGSRI